jgi:hypothetical protein
MDGAPEFEDAWVRMQRAWDYFQRLKSELADFPVAHPEAYGVVSEADADGNLTLRARVTMRLPKEWGLLIGDILVDLRSALDYAVYALAVCHSGQVPPPNPRRIEFPIWDNQSRESSGRGSHQAIADVSMSNPR